MGQKIATCCYCGTRAALTLHGKVQHELACSSCGAPLHDLKMMPVKPKSHETHYSKPLKQKKSKGHKKYDRDEYYRTKDLKKKKSKKSKSWGKKLFDGVDDLFDLFD
jgi:hypothetical protein